MKSSRIGWLLAAGLVSSLMMACTLEQAVRTGVDVVTSSDPASAAGKAAERAARQRVEGYARNPEQVFEDAKTVSDSFKRVLAYLRGEVGSIWGDKETKTPSRKVYVKYSKGYESRALIEFDAGRIRVETVDGKSPRQSLKDAVVMTLMTPDDPRAVDLYSAAPVKLGGTPYLSGLVTDQQGRFITTQAQAEDFADHLWNRALKTRKISVKGKSRTVRFVEFQMVAGHIQAKAKHYLPLVRKHADRFSVSRGLVLAVTQVESGFNPFAVSPVPAYGLMQLVPGSAGADAYKHARGKAGVPGKAFLFDPSNNIELGSAYLDLLNSRYLAGIDDPVAREYCVIAGYNGGAGAVLRSFDKDRNKALVKVNAMSPAQVYKHLLANLPASETRRYLLKVNAARKAYIGI